MAKELEELDRIQEEAKKAALPAIGIEPQTEEKVDFDTFCKSDFRAVKVKDCQRVKKSDKLLKFTLDDGTGTDRQIGRPIGPRCPRSGRLRPRRSGRRFSRSSPA